MLSKSTCNSNSRFCFNFQIRFLLAQSTEPCHFFSDLVNKLVERGILVLNCEKSQRWPTRHDVCELFEESGCGWHAGHLVSWGMVGTRWAWWSMPAMPTMSPHLDRQGHPLTTRPMTRRFLCNNTHHQAREQEGINSVEF